MNSAGQGKAATFWAQQSASSLTTRSSGLIRFAWPLFVLKVNCILKIHQDRSGCQVLHIGCRLENVLETHWYPNTCSACRCLILDPPAEIKAVLGWICKIRENSCENNFHNSLWKWNSIYLKVVILSTCCGPTFKSAMTLDVAAGALQMHLVIDGTHFQSGVS